MQVKIFCPLWGHEHWDIDIFLKKVANAGFDGIECWLPPGKKEKLSLYHYLNRHQFGFIAHQHEAKGNTFRHFCSSYKKNLASCAEADPLCINSHTGKDYFNITELLTLIDIASEFTYKTGVPVYHETHRGRLGYCPQQMQILLERRPQLGITADFSHWVCVTESMLQNFEAILNDTINNTCHVHARVGFEEGPQIPDPRAPEWAATVERFFSWWDAIVKARKLGSSKILSFTTEFGPEPYMPKIPYSTAAMVNQFEVNEFMRRQIAARYAVYR